MTANNPSYTEDHILDLEDLQPIGFVIRSVNRLSRAKPGDVQEIAASQIQLLTSYYDLVLGQARRSFRWALIAAGIGLLFFLVAITSLLLQNSQNLSTASLVSGALIEVISGINFYLYGKTAAQLAKFHSPLDMTQRFLLANSLCESLDGEFKQKVRRELIAKIADITSVGFEQDDVAAKQPLVGITSDT